jgi:hypothetical protein
VEAAETPLSPISGTLNGKILLKVCNLTQAFFTETENKEAVTPTYYNARITEKSFEFIPRLVTEASANSADDFNTWTYNSPANWKQNSLRQPRVFSMLFNSCNLTYHFGM